MLTTSPLSLMRYKQGPTVAKYGMLTTSPISLVRYKQGLTVAKYDMLTTSPLSLMRYKQGPDYFSGWMQSAIWEVQV